MTHEAFMRRAIRMAQDGISAGQTPFAAVIVRDQAVIAATHNTVWRDNDPTAHAEVNAIRGAATQLRTVTLAGCTMYSTCEPCPMCLTASHWAKLDAVYFGAMIADAQAAGFSELCVEARHLADLGGSPLRISAGLLREECADLFVQWRAAGLSLPY